MKCPGCYVPAAVKRSHLLGGGALDRSPHSKGRIVILILNGNIINNCFIPMVTIWWYIITHKHWIRQGGKEARWTDSKPKGQITRRRFTKDDLLGGYFIIDINFLQSLFFVRLLDICRYGGKSAHFGRVISCFGFEICSSDVLVGELHIAVARQAASVLHPVEFFLG